jgi:outer membrane protein assembly factor BamB
MLQRFSRFRLPLSILQRMVLVILIGCLVLITVMGIEFSRGHAMPSEVHQQHAATSQTAAVPSGDWPQFGFLAKGGRFNSNETTLTTSNVSQLALDWNKPANNFGGQPAPVVVNGIVYLATFDGKVNAYNDATGAILWSFQAGGVFQSSPAVANGIVYVGSGDSWLYALNATTGAVLWNYLTRDDLSGSAPVVANGIVYIGSVDHFLYAINATNGFLVWKKLTGQGVGSPVVANGVVYVGSSDNRLYAFNATNGNMLWNHIIGAGGVGAGAAPVVANGVVYIETNLGNVGSQSGTFFALDATTGAVLWTFLAGGGVTPALANGVVYMTSGDGRVYALDASTGTQLWATDNSNGFSSSPAIANGVVYVGTDTSTGLVALDASSGQQLGSWSIGNSGGDYRVDSPIVANGVVYFASIDGNLYAYHLQGMIP